MKRKIVYVGVILLAIGIVAIVFSLWQMPFQEQEPYNIPKSYTIINESFSVRAGTSIHKQADFIEGDSINIHFRVTSGGNLDVDFYLVDDENWVLWNFGDLYSSLVYLSRQTSYNNNITIPHSGTWHFVWDNNFSWITQKGVTATITKNWNEIAYRDITVYHTVVPSEYSTYVEYLGIALVLSSIAVISWGFVSKEKTEEPHKNTTN